MRTKKDTITVSKDILNKVLQNSLETRSDVEKHIRNQNDRLLAMEGQILAKKGHQKSDPHGGIAVGAVIFTEPDNVTFRTKDLFRQVVKVLRQHGVSEIKMSWKEYDIS